MATTKMSLLDIESLPPLRPNKRDEALYNAIVNDKNIKDSFNSALTVSNSDNADGTVYTGDTGEILGFRTDRASYECYQAAVAAAAVVSPYQSGDGLEAQPVAAGDALEITNGTTSSSRAAWTVGTDAFYCEATIKVDDISDVTEFFYGFRKAEAYQADPDDYDEMASFNVGKDADGQVEIHTILNDGTTSETDTTLADWANGGEHTLRINVALDGTCTFLYDGAEPTVTAGFKFDAGEVVVPFFHLNTETGDPGVSISSWECGASKVNLG